MVSGGQDVGQWSLSPPSLVLPHANKLQSLLEEKKAYDNETAASSSSPFTLCHEVDDMLNAFKIHP